MQRVRLVPSILIVLALAGLAISSYLTISHYGDQPIECAGLGECDFVNSSEYASLGGVPVSVLGAGMYLMLLASAVYWLLLPQDDKRSVIYWGLALAGAGYAGYLTYVELDILHAICIWCVASATILTAGLVISTLTLFLAPIEAED